MHSQVRVIFGKMEKSLSQSVSSSHSVAVDLNSAIGAAFFVSTRVVEQFGPIVTAAALKIENSINLELTRAVRLQSARCKMSLLLNK